MMNRLSAALVALCVVACAWGQGAEPEMTYQLFVVQVVDGWSGDPMPDVEVKAVVGSDRDARITDADGKVTLMVPADARRVGVSVACEGWLPMGVAWRDLGKGQVLPLGGFVLKLPEATGIGGVVVDEDGKPVEGASVELDMPGGGYGAEHNGKPRVDLDGVEIKTDAQGKWESNSVPEDLAGLELAWSHPDFLKSDDEQPQPTGEALRDFSAELVLKRGVTVAGQLLDAAGDPVADAEVWAGAEGRGYGGYGGGGYRSGGDRETTDAQGRFALTNLPDGKLKLLVQSRTHAPRVQRVVAEGERVEVDPITLDPGKRLHGRVVDAAGEPVAGVMVNLGSWQNEYRFEWETQTDDDGRWEWLHAPAEGAVVMRFDTEGYVGLDDQTMAAREEPYEVTLLRPMVVTGTVIDAATRQPIPSFTVTPGYTWSEFDTEPDRWRHARETFKDGEFHWTFTNSHSKLFLFVTAEGYLTVASPPYDNTGQERAFGFEVEMVVDEGLAGRVVTAEGKPAAGVEVIAYQQSTRGGVKNGRFESWGDERKAVVTDEQGAFTLPTPGEAYVLMVLSDAGAAIVPQAEFEAGDGAVTLQAWARIEGTVHRGTQTLANVAIIGQQENHPDEVYQNIYLNIEYTTTSDAEGKFVLDRVVPGRVTLGREVEDGGSYTRRVSDTSSPALSGQTVVAKIGGKGRPIIGRIRLPDDLPPIPGGWAHSWVYSVPKEIKRPERAKPRKRGLFARLTESGGPQPVYQPVRVHRRYSVTLDDDGRFRIDDVRSGAYRFSYSVYGPKGGGASDGNYNPVEYVLKFYFEVDRVEGGVTDEPQDLGDVPVKVHRKNYAPTEAEAEAAAESEAEGEAEIEAEVETEAGVKTEAEPAAELEPAGE